MGKISKAGDGKNKQAPIFEMVKRPATERIFPPLPVLKESLPKEDESDLSLDIVCNVVLVLPMEYDVPSEVNEIERDFTKEMVAHKPLCYYVMDNGCVENQHAVFEKPKVATKLHLKPLFIQAKINGVGVNKMLVDGGATVNLIPQSFLGKIGLSDSHNVVLTNYEGTTGNSLGAVKVDLIVGSVSRTTMFMVVPSKANFNVLLGREWIHGVGAVPSTLHQRIAIWREDGLVENIEADQSYFRAEVHHITRENFDKQLANIPPVMSLGPKFTLAEDEMYTMKLHPGCRFMWERELLDHDYVIVDHGETSAREEEVLRTRASAYKKVTNNLSPGSVEYAVSPKR